MTFYDRMLCFKLKSINVVPHKNPFSFFPPLHLLLWDTLSPNEVYRHKTLKGHSHALFRGKTFSHFK